jgi:hypothetical protein
VQGVCGAQGVCEWKREASNHRQRIVRLEEEMKNLKDLLAVK